MRRRVRLALGLVVGMTLAWGLGGTALAADEGVAIAGFAFAPASVTVTEGDSVTWTNDDGVAHTATGEGGAFDTGNIAGGASATVTFSTAGTFAYICTIHPSMTGTVVVEAAAAATATPAPTEDPGNSGGGSTGGAKPPATDTVAPIGAQNDGHDPIGSIAAMLAILGLAMLIGTYGWGRRAATEEPIDRD